MELDLFELYYSDLYEMMDGEVRYALAEYKITGEESLRDWDNMIDSIVKRYEYPESYQYNMAPARDSVMAQQFGDDFRDRDRGDRDHRRRFRHLNLRDIVRLLFLRRLFDRDRH